MKTKDLSRRRKRILKKYNRISNRVLKKVGSDCDWEQLNSIFQASRQELQMISWELPFIGKYNMWNFFLEINVINLAICKALEKKGHSREDAVDILYFINETFLDSVPYIIKKAIGKIFFSNYYKNLMRRGADLSQMREYENDWVYDYIVGDGIAFDFKLDVQECAICKFFQQQGAADFLSVICKIDYLIGKEFNLGFRRTSTIGEGKPGCDLSFKQYI